MSFQNKRLIAILIGAALLLSIPSVAMKLGGSFTWGWFDFAAAGVLLFGTGLAFEIAFRVMKTTGQRIAAGAAILAILALVWVEIAVGLFGTPLAGN